LNNTAIARGDPFLYDVTIDDDPKTYQRVRLESFLRSSSSSSSNFPEGQGGPLPAEEECRLVLKYMLRAVPDEDIQDAFQEILTEVISSSSSSTSGGGGSIVIVLVLVVMVVVLIVVVVIVRYVVRR